MSNQSKAKTHNIFLIDKEKVKHAFFHEEDVDANTIINAIMQTAKFTYDEQELLSWVMEDKNAFKARLFFREEKQSNNKLSQFCESFVKEDQKIMKFNPSLCSSVLFLYSNNNIYAVTTGQGFRVITEYCVQKFGILVIGTYNKIFRVTAVDYNGLASLIHSSKTIYSNEIDFLDVDSLDNVFKEVSGRLNDKSTVHSILDLSKESKRRSVKIIAKDYLQFSSSLSFKRLVHLLGIIDQYDFSALKDNFNIIDPINSKQDKLLIDKLNNKVITDIFNAISNDTPLGYDIFHKSTEEFIGSDEYYFLLGPDQKIGAVDEIYPSQFLKKGYCEYIDDDCFSLDSFVLFIRDVRIVAQKDDAVRTSGTLLEHLSGEFELDGKSYYMFYGNYYYLTESYSERLNTSLRGKLGKERVGKYLETEWEKNENEDTFNHNVSIKENYALLHRIIIDYIEFADLLSYKDNVIRIVHVKDGFDNDMRALDRQVELSIKRLLDIRNNNNDDFFRLLYKKSNEDTRAQKLSDIFGTEDNFMLQLKQAEIQYLIVLRPPKEDLIENKSNIAKHCLNALILRCFNHGIDLKISIAK